MKATHKSKNVLMETDIGEWVESEPIKYYRNIFEKVSCFFGFHQICTMIEEKPQGRHCYKCMKFF